MGLNLNAAAVHLQKWTPALAEHILCMPMETASASAVADPVNMGSGSHFPHQAVSRHPIQAVHESHPAMPDAA